MGIPPTVKKLEPKEENELKKIAKENTLLKVNNINIEPIVPKVIPEDSLYEFFDDVIASKL